MAAAPPPAARGTAVSAAANPALLSPDVLDLGRTGSVSEAAAEISLEPGAEAVPRLLDAIEAFAEAAALPIRAAHHLALIAEEVVANVVMHGSEGEGAARAIHVVLRREGAALHLAIEDDGPEFDPLAALPPDVEADIDRRDPGGLGLHLIRSLAREARYQRAGGRNRLTLLLDAGA